MNGNKNDLTDQILPILASDPIRAFNRTTKDKPFYMVYGEKPPTKIHYDFNGALSESLRLSQLNPGRKFFILQSVTVTQSEILPVRTERLVD